MKKKLLAFVLAAMLVVACSSCTIQKTVRVDPNGGTPPRPEKRWAV